jgi:hypothetical protein
MADKSRMTAAARWYIAGEAFSRYGDVEPDLGRKLRRNIRRNLGLSLTVELVQRTAEHYKAMYDYGARRLGRYLTPPRGRYVDYKDVRIPQFQADLRRRYPREPRRLVEMAAWYVVHYEYIR